MNLSVIKDAGLKLFHKASFQTQKHSPEILIGLGIAGVVAGTILACRATLKAKPVLEDAKAKLDDIKGNAEERQAVLENLGSNADEKNELALVTTKDKTQIYTATAIDLVKLYAGPTLLVAGGIASILCAYNVMNKRSLAILATCKGLQQAYESYRARVVEDYGEEIDRDFHLGLRNSESIETVIGSDGKKKKQKVTVKIADPNAYSQYAKWFDETVPNWRSSAELNMSFIRMQQNYANDLLKIRGHIFLNEVYDLLGIDRTQSGAVVGWVLDLSPENYMDRKVDNYIDFGVFVNDKEQARAFVNGNESRILLDFNVDGIIYDLI